MHKPLVFKELRLAKGRFEARVSAQTFEPKSFKSHMKRVLLSTPSLNTEGFRILTEGIDLRRFKANPVLFLMHDASGLPIGKWVDPKVEGGELTAEPEFDMDDPRGAEAARKFEKGYLNAASIGIRILETSDRAELLAKGQMRPTVTRSELMEASLVGLPANGDCTVKLSSESGRDGIDELLPLIGLSVQNQPVPMDLKKIAAALGLPDSADESAVLSAVAALKKSEVDSVLALGAQNGHVTDANRTAWETLAAKDLASARMLLSQPKPVDPDEKPEGEPEKSGATKPATVSAFLKAQQGVAGNGNGDKDKKDWGFADWEKKDPSGLLALKKSDPAAYAQLAANYKPA